MISRRLFGCGRGAPRKRFQGQGVVETIGASSQIEHVSRPLTVTVLVRLTEVFGGFEMSDVQADTFGDWPRRRLSFAVPDSGVTTFYEVLGMQDGLTTLMTANDVTETDTEVVEAFRDEVRTMLREGVQTE